MWLNFLLIIVLVSASFSLQSIGEKEITRIYRSVLKNYEKRSVPIKDGKPVPVLYRMYINNMVPRKKAPMHFHVDAFITMFWQDFRTAYNASDIIDTDYLYLPYDHRLVEKIWMPNLYFVESKFGYKNDIPQPNQMVYLYPNGTIGFNFRLSMDMYCPMKMHYFPFDKQKCNMTIETYSYNTGYIRLFWKKFEYTNKLYIADFAKVEMKNYRNPSQDYGLIGFWDQLIVEFTFHRNAWLYLIRDFFPCFIIVSLSWINFWITHRSTPARVALGITTVLTIVTMTNAVRTNSPSSGLFRSIDVYMLCCNLFVFGALCEAALVGMTAPSKKHANQKKKKDENENKNKHTIKNGLRSAAGFQNPAFENNLSITQNEHHNNGTATTTSTTTVRSKLTLLRRRQTKLESKKEEDKTFNPMLTKIKKYGPFYFYTGDVHIVDKISRVFFPVSFLLFNLVFFLMHHLQSDDLTVL